jgi:hypothetical protein
MAPVRPVLHRLSCSNKTVRNIPKHEFWVQWSGSGVFVTKSSNATSFSKPVRWWCQFGQFCVEFRAVRKRSETPQNISFGCNGVDRLRLLWKISMQLRLANLCINGTCSANFASTFVQFPNGPKHPETWVLGPMEWIGCARYERFWRNFV